MEKFRRATVQFCLGVEVDGYQTPSGEYRFGVNSVSKVLGYAENWLYRLTSRGGRTLKALQGEGFTAYQLEGMIADGKPGASTVSTISLDDFTVLIRYAVAKGKPEAIAFNDALVKSSLRDFCRDAFGERPLTSDEKRQLFYSDQAKALNWAKEDADDLAAIEEQERFLRYGE